MIIRLSKYKDYKMKYKGLKKKLRNNKYMQAMIKCALNCRG